ncbi:MAG: hypothetical protein ACE5JI_18570 [Acidobacteriota bacterium]
MKNRIHRVVWHASLVVLLTQLPGCGKRVKAEFKRPPAAASAPAPEEVAPEEPPAEPEPAAVASEPAQRPSQSEAPPPPASPKGSRPPSSPSAPPAPEPPTPRLSSDSGSEARSIRDKLDRAESILASLRYSSLSTEQNEQAAAARAFVSQARRALEAGDYRRAAVLADKGLILAEDLERSSRP